MVQGFKVANPCGGRFLISLLILQQKFLNRLRLLRVKIEGCEGRETSKYHLGSPNNSFTAFKTFKVEKTSPFNQCVEANEFRKDSVKDF